MFAIHFAASHWGSCLLFVKRLLYFSIGLIGVCSYATDQPLSVYDAAEQAALHAPALRAEAYRINATRAEAGQAGRLPDPELILGIDGLPVQGSRAFDNRHSDMTVHKLGIGFTLPSGEKRRAERSLAASSIAVSEANWQFAELASQRIGAEAWIELWSAKEELELLNALMESAELLESHQMAQFGSGISSVQVTLAASLDRTLLEDRLDDAQLRIQVAQARLERLIPGASAQAIGQAPDFSVLPQDINTLFEQLVNDPAVRRLNARLDQADAAAALAQSQLKPDWRVGMYYGQRARFDDLVGLEVGISLPFLQRKNQKMSIAARRAEKEAVEADREDTLRARRELLSQTAAQWQRRTQQVERFRQQLLPLAADRSAAALAAWQGGGSQQDWLNARQDEINLRIRFAQTLASWGQSWAALVWWMPAAESME